MCFHDPNLKGLKFGNPYIIDEIFEVIENKKIILTLSLILQNYFQMVMI